MPIDDFCKTRSPAELPMALLLPVFQQYEPAFEPNACLEALPKTYQEAGELVKKRMGRK